MGTTFVTLALGAYERVMDLIYIIYCEPYVRIMLSIRFDQGPLFQLVQAEEHTSVSRDEALQLQDSGCM